MDSVREQTEPITQLILQAAERARAEVAAEPEPELTRPIDWPIDCTVGPGLEGAIACETRIGYVNGTKGWLIYRGYDIFELCAYSTFEEVSYLLLHGRLPGAKQLKAFKDHLAADRQVPQTKRMLMGFPVEKMNTMAALRLGADLLRQEFTQRDLEAGRPDVASAIGADEDSIPMETKPMGEKHAIYEFTRPGRSSQQAPDEALTETSNMAACYHLIAGMPTIAAAVARIRAGLMPIEPDPNLSHAANLLYMMTGKVPTPAQTRVMDVSLILHADHGMNASTFAAMVVASTLSDAYFAVGAGIGALNGPLHGGANEQVLRTLREIGSAANVPAWYANARANKQKIVGFGHRVYKALDPRARVLAPLADYLARDSRESAALLRIARALEKQVVSTLGKKKGVFTNVDFYSGIVYACLGIPVDMFTPMFAVSRISGWSARILEYLTNNRIFRPRAMYIGPLDKRFPAARTRNAAR